MTTTSTNSAAMTAAEFRILRDRLGLPGAWIATHLGITDRAVRRWENGAAPITEARAEQIRDLDDQTTSFIAGIVDALDAEPVHADAAWIVTYASDAAYRAVYPDLDWPASWHRAAIGRVAQQRPHVRITYLGSNQQ